MNHVTTMQAMIPILPEIVLALGAMAVLMIGVGLGDRTSSVINGLSIGVIMCWSLHVRYYCISYSKI